MTITVRGQFYRFVTDRKNADFYLTKIHTYENECGCFLGAILVVFSVVAFTLYTLVVDWTSVNIVVHGLSGGLFIFLAAGVGKAIGIGIARVRLQLLYKFLIRHKYLELYS